MTPKRIAAIESKMRKLESMKDKILGKYMAIEHRAIDRIRVRRNKRIEKLDAKINHLFRKLPN